MSDKLLALIEEVENGKFDDNELIDLVLYLWRENNILLKENSEFANKNQELEKMDNFEKILEEKKGNDV